MCKVLFSINREDYNDISIVIQKLEEAAKKADEPMTLSDRAYLLCRKSRLYLTIGHKQLGILSRIIKRRLHIAF